MLTPLPRKKRRDSNKRASTEPGAVQLMSAPRVWVCRQLASRIEGAGFNTFG